MDKVVVPEQGTFKCVILTDGTNKVFRAGRGEYHKNVVWMVKRQEPELTDYRVAGGGRIAIKPGHHDWDTNKWVYEQHIRVYGYSVDFGEMDIDDVEELVAPYAKQLGLEFINETGNGY